MLSASIVNGVMEVLIPCFKIRELPKIGCILLATVKGDIHDIEKMFLK